MVEIRFKSNFEVVDVAGKTLADVRKDFMNRFSIPENAKIKLNDRKVRGSQESNITVHDSDEVRFVVEKGGKAALLVGAMLLALALTGGVFAFGYLTNSTTLTGVVAAQTDFARITIPSGAPTWNVFGSTKGQIGSGNLFNVSTQGTSANYTGDITVTVSLANADQLVKVYRVLNLFITTENSTGGAWDINLDGTANSKDFALLTLGNGSVDLFINQTAGSDNYTVKLDHGFYVSNVWGQGWTSGYQQPQLYAEVYQR